MFVDRRGIILAALLCAIPAITSAQETREETITRLQAEKATRLRPYQPNLVEEVLARFQGALILEPSGFYPAFGSVYSGGGFTLGAGYRQYIGDRLNWNLYGLYSIKNYKLIELTLHSPRPLSGIIDFEMSTGWRDATQVSFHGLGIDSPETGGSYRVQQGYVGGELSIRPLPWAMARAGLMQEEFTLSNGGGSEPPIDQVHTPETAPGLGASPDYFHTFASVAVDTRPSPDYARHGSLYQVAFHRFDDPRNRYSFGRIDADAVQHIPVLRENWVVSLRGRLQTTPNDSDVVPYFLLPSLGSGSTLRGYSSWRFRDRHSLLLSAEWRWIPNRLAMDAAIFYDAGTVADRFDALSLGQMKGNVGIGVRFHSPVTTPLRIELARGREGFKLIFASSPSF